MYDPYLNQKNIGNNFKSINKIKFLNQINLDGIFSRLNFEKFYFN